MLKFKVLPGKVDCFQSLVKFSIFNFSKIKSERIESILIIANSESEFKSYLRFKSSNEKIKFFLSENVVRSIAIPAESSKELI